MSAREKILISESSNMKEEFAAEIEISSMMKIQYDQLVITSGQKTDSLLESENENKNLREALGQLQCLSIAQEKSLISESSNVKEEFAAEIEICSMMKTRYNQLVLTLGQKTDSLLKSENENKNLRQALGQLQYSSSARLEFLITESSKVKEEFAAEIEKCSMLKNH